jgi:hypothetical protein
VADVGIAEGTLDVVKELEVVERADGDGDDEEEEEEEKEEVSAEEESVGC